MDFLPAPAATFVLALIAIVLIGSCVSTGPTSNLRAANKSMIEIENGLNSYHDQYNRWPASVGVLQSYAAQRGRDIDLGPFSNISVSAVNTKTAMIRFATRPPDSKQGVFAITRTPLR